MIAPAFSWGALTAGRAATIEINEIVSRHIAAVGGRAAIAQLHDYSLTLEYREGSFAAESSLAQARPYFRRVSVPAGPITKDSVLEGYDGSAWEYYGDPGVTLRTVGAAGAISRRNAHQFIDVLVDAAANGTKLSSLGARYFEGRAVYDIFAHYADGTNEEVFVDKQTYLIDGVQQDLAFHAFGSRIQSIIEQDDYRSVGGVLMPFRSRQIDVSTGKVLDTTTVASAVANAALTPNDFAPPAFTPTKLQAMIAAIYEEREDPDAVMSTYRDYRTILLQDSVSTLAAVDFIGYQCLKMGEVRTAVHLLAANAADYPRSARAHFGLGRALVLSGDVAGARAQFKQALTLDPTYKRAGDALRDLPSDHLEKASPKPSPV